MPKVDSRNEVGTIVHAVPNKVLSDHAAKNIYGNVKYAKMFLQGTVVNVFDGCAPGGKNAVGSTSRCPPKNLRSESN